MIRRLRYGAVIGVIIGALIVSACGQSTTGFNTKNNNIEGERVQNSDAETLYMKKCVTCHGTDLQGRAGPNLQSVGSTLTQEEIARIVTDGRKGMPKFGTKLSEAEIQSISKWLSEHK
ncbi:c-type cytochrome [Paenibacillus sp. Leaf72]|uniref:c-type cytochrome n=1 Tax=Paenibacillus sp. Leaf72 TaxID=1736234 RepID=UPI0006FD4787|nr:cytochrome c [Paenibacillus sp. Leaf72]KQN99845.1 hypothetical protein ASF12_16755 [Paenibacillus sp. Leaf72]